MELAAPDPPEIEVCGAVGVDEGGGVDAEGAWDWFCIRSEGAFRVGGLGDADLELPLLVAGREVGVVLPVGEGGVGGPDLFRGPRDLGEGEGGAVVGYIVGIRRGGEGYDVVVYHVVLGAMVIVWDGCFAVMGGIDVDSIVEGVGRGIGDVDVF